MLDFLLWTFSFGKIRFYLDLIDAAFFISFKFLIEGKVIIVIIWFISIYRKFRKNSKNFSKIQIQIKEN
jgi:hypothetical protein